MGGVPAAVARAAAGFGLKPERLHPLAGNSGSAWSDGEVVLRVGARVASELRAAEAAAGHVPVPRVLGRLELDDGVGAALLELVAGRPAGEFVRGDPARGAAVGRACGALHDALAAVACPPGIRDAPGARCRERRLLHLDLHPFNVLVDGDGAPAAVLDWANAAAGDPELDRARTWSILTLDPAARALAADPGWAAMTANWIDAAPPVAARAWACRFMLSDLARRYTAPELAHIRDAQGH
jgi:aminoglycoside phosphotransferase (APT) family kinase protein